MTSISGYYYINHSYWDISEVNYDIKWERDDYDIREAAYGQTYTVGPKKKGGWNLTINSAVDYSSYMYAWVNNAANYYYYNSHLMGIQPPPSHTPRPYLAFLGARVPILGQRMKLNTTTGWTSLQTSHYLSYNAAWNAAQIALKFTTNENSRDIFATTCHELGHASHFSLGFTNADYALNMNNNRKFAESWAQCIGWFMATKYFGTGRYVYNIYNNFPHNLTFDTNTPLYESVQYLYLVNQKEDDYTSAFIDLIDNFSQTDCPESASGYTIEQLEESIRRTPKNWDSIRSQIFNDYPSNPTKSQMWWILYNYK